MEQSASNNRVYLPNSESEIQDYKNINVSALVQDMIDDASGSHGFLLQQISETIYRSMIFASSDNENADLRPELVVRYIEPILTDSCVVFRPGAEEGKDAFLRSLDPDVNRATHPDFTAHTGTNGGLYVAARGIIDFDLKSLPENIEVASSVLRLYSYDSSSNGSHAAYEGGNNEAQLFRVIEDWKEDEVTWNNQPAVTEQNMQVLNETTNEILNYTMYTTDLVQDYLADRDNSFGFLIKQTEEEPYGRLIFGSSDNENALLHPSLEVCYNVVTNVTNHAEGFSFSVFPNPTAEFLNFSLDGLNRNYLVLIYNSEGRLERSHSVSSDSNRINIIDLASGTYTVSILGENNSVLLASKKILKF